MLDRAEAAQILQLVDIDMPVVDLVATLPQEIADHVLARSFRAAGRGNRNKIPRRGKLRVEAGIDGVEDSLLGVCGVHCVGFPVVAFRIASAPIHSGGGISRPMETRMPANRNILYLIIGALFVAVGVLGYNLYQTRKQPEGLQINVGPSGLKIQIKCRGSRTSTICGSASAFWWMTDQAPPARSRKSPAPG